MTCIVGIAHDGRVWLGADSAGVDAYALQIRDRADEKVFANGDAVIAYTSSFRMGQVLRYRLQVPAIDTWDLWRWMSVDFVDAVRKAYRDAGWLRTDSGQESSGSFLVGIRGQLFHVHGDLQVGCVRDGITADGCGDQLALGAIHALRARGERDPERLIRAGLEAAAHYSCGVRAPFVVLGSPCA